MMKYLLFGIVYLLAFEVVFSQPNHSLDTIKIEKGKNTVLKISNQNNQVVEIIRLRNGRKHGIQQKFQHDVKPLETKQFKNGNLHGEWLTFDYQGNLREKRNYKYNRKRKASLLSGLFEQYLNNTLVKRAKYKDSLLHGKFEEFHSNGNQKTIAYYKNGLLSGEKSEFNNQGRLMRELNYKVFKSEGSLISELQGKATYHHSNGQVSASGNYERGLKSGLWTTYSQSGFKDNEITYKEDKKHGSFTYYYQDGKVRSKGYFYDEITINDEVKKRVNDGKHESFFKTGELERVEFYDMGKKTGKWLKHYESGQLAEVKTFEDDVLVGEHVNYEKNGDKIFQTYYKITESEQGIQSVKHGVERRWSKGILTSEIEYINGLQNGKAVNYDAHGNIDRVMNFLEGKLNGEFKEFYPNGQLKSEKYYRDIGRGNSKMVGWQKDYSEKGELYRLFYKDSTGNLLFTKLLHNNQPTTIEIKDAFHIEYFPESDKIRSIKLFDKGSHPIFAQYYFLNGEVRKITFQNPNTFNINHIDFMANGNPSGVYGSQQVQDSLMVSSELIHSLKNAVGNIVKENEFFKLNNWNGQYHLKYGNGKPFLELNFKQNVLDGKMVSYAPIEGDTTSFKEFHHFALKELHLSKYAGIQTTYRSTFSTRDSIKIIEQYRHDGTPVKKTKYKNEMLFFTREYHQNGNIKNERDDLANKYIRYDLEGRIIEENTPIKPESEITVRKIYFPESNEIKSITHYKSGKLHGLYEQYFEPEKLQFRSYYEEGLKHGDYVAYNKEGELIWQGLYVNDKKEGEWLKLERGNLQTIYFENDQIVLKPTNIQCSCIDTTHKASDIKFVPLLKHLLAYSVLNNSLPNYIVPVDSLNYNSLFYSGFQFSNNRSSGFSTFDLIMFKEFSLAMPSDQQIKLTLNPCSTPTYVDRMNVNAHYNTNHPVEARVTLNPKRIALSFLKGPMKSNDKNYANFTAHYDVVQIKTGTEEFFVQWDEHDQGCFIDGRIHNFIEVKINAAKPMVFKNPKNHVPDFHLNKLKLKPTELENFFGLLIEESEFNFSVEKEGKNHSLKAKSNLLLAGGNFVSGTMELVCKKTENGDFYFPESNLSIAEKDLKLYLHDQKLTRIQFEHDHNNELLKISFFTE